MITETFWAGRAQRQIARLLNSSDPADVANGSLLDRVVNGTPSMQILEQQYPQLKGDHEIMPDIRDYPLHPGCMAVDAPPPEMAGKKFDAGKVDPSFLFEYFPRALLAMASVCGYGARKYIRGGWRTVPEGIQRYTAAHDRHRFLEHIEGPYDDGDSGLAHAVQVLWNAAARVEFMLETGAIEDRTGNEIGPDGKPILGTSKKR